MHAYGVRLCLNVLVLTYAASIPTCVSSVSLGIGACQLAYLCRLHNIHISFEKMIYIILYNYTIDNEAQISIND